MGVIVISTLVGDGLYLLGAALFIITTGVNVVFLRPRLYPVRWLSPGLAFAALFALYPVIFTVYTAFTNYGDGHLLTKQQTIELLEGRRYVPEEVVSHSWYLYESAQGELLLLLERRDGTLLAASPDGSIWEVEASGEAPPERVRGYNLIPAASILSYLPRVEDVTFGDPGKPYTVRSIDSAVQAQQRFRYRESEDTLTDRKGNITYRADDKRGVFTTERGKRLEPGYRVPIGAENFVRLMRSPALQGPFLRVFLWTFTFAAVSVVSTFFLGLILALLSDGIPPVRQKIFRSLFILPHAIPGVIGILVWRGLLNPHVGTVTAWLEALLGFSPAWFSDPFWTRVAVLAVNLWLGFPYMLLVTSGALKSIPRELFEAARADGAGIFQVFRRVTLPMILVATGPILISAFAMNFNNFNVIYLFNEGGPPIANSPTPAGHTDILISYTYRLAFESGRGADYGFASAITVIIFVLLVIVTLINFRYTRVWEEISENA